MISISLCMIVKNEEDVITRCLDSVKDIVDEIIIVDTGSNDSTVEKVKQYGAKVYEFEWVDDFAKARNYSFSKATKDYILWLDADDVMRPDDVEKFKELKSNLDRSVDSVTMKYILGLDENNNATSSLRRNRLVKREKNFIWIGKIHEYLNVYGNIRNCDISVVHMKNKPHTDRNLKIFKKMIEEKVPFSTRDIFYYANELYYNDYKEEASIQYKKFLDTNDGWVEDIKTACSNLSEYYYSIGDKENELKYIFKSFEYDVPRSDFCCRLGYKFLNENNINSAIFWYLSAISNKPSEDNLGLVSHHTYTWLPLLQLCVCYSKINKFEEANIFNEKAAKYVPDHPSVKHNREFLKGKLKELEESNNQN
ncbi:glycosyl transferase group 2 family protein [Gottschalkia purinilytica]|uniref:Glycosyl transferase group 2 family protein n=1 Tax=Gottschalkia purinilytica TaxID=1503 RepID=A0A0L0WBI6_GOTPU|nr:glycosyltransferase family 2 protein [Gottschalkia purinilytica]KNF08894.1 glycosyl transferase group 2 family protein [Gottschalkia purinilytica]